MCLAPKPPQLPPPPEPAVPPPEVVTQVQPATIAQSVSSRQRNKRVASAGTSQLRMPMGSSSLNINQPSGSSQSGLNISK